MSLQATALSREGPLGASPIREQPLASAAVGSLQAEEFPLPESGRVRGRQERRGQAQPTRRGGRQRDGTGERRCATRCRAAGAPSRLRRTLPKGDPDPGWRRASRDEARGLAARHDPESAAFRVVSPSTPAIDDSPAWILRSMRASGGPSRPSNDTSGTAPRRPSSASTGSPRSESRSPVGRSSLYAALCQRYPSEVVDATCGVEHDQVDAAAPATG
jgi:hypothetical protein